MDRPGWWGGLYDRDDFNDAKEQMGLDKLGFPAVAIANAILAGQADFGDSAKELEEGWLQWLHHYPFDAAVADKLSSILQEKLDRQEQDQDGSRAQLLRRKLRLAAGRADRYGRENFGQPSLSAGTSEF
jgi:hypothetical protein